jgi:RimJ/RimL family protein N-acetyltransferase
VDGRVVGFIRYAHGWHQDVSFGGFELDKDDVYSVMANLAPAYRNLGVGTEAYRQFIKLMKAQGTNVIYGIPKTPGSARFMRRLGFKKVTLRPSYTEIYKLDL